MTAPSTTICERCHNEFEINIIEEQHRQTLVERYFNCTHCDDKYLIDYTNSRIRQEVQSIKVAHEKLIRRKQRLQDEVNKLESKMTST